MMNAGHVVDFLDRVRRSITVDQLFEPGDTVVVGVSGGADSVALLDILARLAEPFGLTLHIAHLDHQLRADSVADAQFVADLGRGLGIPTTLGVYDVATYARQARLSLEEAGRHARYAFWRAVAAQVGASKVALAHHADDQAETVLLHLIRGTGLAGLRGMRTSAPWPNAPGEILGLPNTASAPAPTVVRPLLGLTKIDILAYLTERGLTYREDVTNLDPIYTRNRVRHELLPLLKTFNPGIVATLGRMADGLADDYAVLRVLVDSAWPAVVSQQGAGLTLDLAALAEQPSAIRRHLIRQGIGGVGSLRDISAEHIVAIMRLAETGMVGEQVHLAGLRITRTYDALFIGRDDPALPDWPLLAPGINLPVVVPGVTPLPDSRWVLSARVVDVNDPENLPPSLLPCVQDRLSLGGKGRSGHQTRTYPLPPPLVGEGSEERSDLTPHPPSLPGKGESIPPPFLGEGPGERSSDPPSLGRGEPVLSGAKEAGGEVHPPPLVGEGSRERSSDLPSLGRGGAGGEVDPPPFVGEGSGERSLTLRVALDATVAQEGLWLRTRQPGDRFQPLGLDGRRQTLHDLMVNAKIPRVVRDRLPILVNPTHIVWVCGLRLDHRGRVTAATRRILYLELSVT